MPASSGRAAPSETTACRRSSRAAASSRTSPPSETPKPAIRSNSGALLEVVERLGHRRLRVVAEPVRVAVALAVAGEVDREHAVAVAGEQAGTVGDARAVARRAVDQHDGGAVARGHVPGGEPVDADVLVRDVQRGDRVARRVRDHQREHRAAAPRARTARRRPPATPPRGRRGGGGRGGRARTARRRRRPSAAARPRSRRGRSRRTSPVPAARRAGRATRCRRRRTRGRRDAERGAGRSRHPRLRPQRGQRDGDDRGDADQRRVGTGERKVEEMDRDEREAGGEQGALEVCEPHW